jgi:hypothetical protein
MARTTGTTVTTGTCMPWKPVWALTSTLPGTFGSELATMTLTDFKPGSYVRGTLRVLPALRLGRHVEIFAGPSFNYIRSEKGRGIDLVSHYLWSEKEGSGTFHGLYIGGMGGLQVNF